MDVKAIFRLVDVDKSGNISRTVILNTHQQQDTVIIVSRKQEWQGNSY